MTTTIRVPVALESYCDHLAERGHDDVTFVVIGDRKTPAATGDFLRRLARRTGYVIDYWDVARQQDRLRSLPALDRLLPYDSVQRRSLGFLLAYEAGCDRIISVDDDNWPTEDDFFAGHQVVGSEADLPSIASSTGWFNTARLLDVVPPKPLYHRGFPTAKRGLSGELTRASLRGRVVANAGLWTGVPDLDAISHLDSPVRTVGLSESFPGRLVVAPGTRTVFNTQNTSFHRDLLPCLFLIPMGDRIGALEVGRYDDVWMSMFVKVVADHLGDLVCVGRPLVDQIRNEHDLFRDALVELPAMKLTNRLLEPLAEVTLHASDYLSCYHELIDALRERVPAGAFDEQEAGYVRVMLDRMEAWAQVVSSFLHA